MELRFKIIENHKPTLGGEYQALLSFPTPEYCVSEIKIEPFSIFSLVRINLLASALVESIFS